MITNLLKRHGKAGKRQRSRWLGIWLLFTLLLTVGQRAEAQDFRIADPKNYTVIASEKGYISFQIPFYDDDGNNEYVRPGDGQLSVQIDSGEKKRS